MYELFHKTIPCMLVAIYAGTSLKSARLRAKKLIPDILTRTDFLKLSYQQIWAQNISILWLMFCYLHYYSESSFFPPLLFSFVLLPGVISIIVLI